MGKVTTYRDLEVWKTSMDLVEAIYKISRYFPKDERFSLTDQIRRASVSVPSNIAEGWGRSRTKEYLHHIAFACGSLMEVETQLIIAVRLDYAKKEDAAPVWELTSRTGKMLNRLKVALEKKLIEPAA